jgi:hypothetical protein
MARIASASIAASVSISHGDKVTPFSAHQAAIS